MDEARLKQLIDDAQSFNLELDGLRATQLRYYEAELRGDERDGYSKVVAHTVEETIEWALPLIIEAFMIPEPVRFEPNGPDDVKQARLETDTIRRLLFDPRGFETLYSWFKDALLHHNGVVKIWVEATEEPEYETYENLDEESASVILADPDTEVVEYARVEDEKGPRIERLKVRRVKQEYELHWEAVPPEEFLISSNWNSIHLDDCPFVAHRKEVTRSELVEMGFDRDTVYSLAADEDANTTDLAIVRRPNRVTFDSGSEVSADQSTERLALYECYVRYDSDGDGIAELHRVFYAGGEILEDEIVEHQPFVAIATHLMPHRFEGRSLSDTVMDIQDIATTLWRQVLDNLYLTNNPRLKVAKGGGVNMEDLTTGGPGAPIRMRDVNAVEPIAIPFTAAPSMQLLEYLNQEKGRRTGIGETYTGQTPDVSNRAAQQAVERVMTAAEQKVRLIARVFAEVGLCAVYKKAHDLLRKYYNKEMLVPYRSDWETVRPSEWRPRKRMVTQVGLGHAARVERRNVLLQVIQQQLAMLQNGGMGTLVSLEHLFNALTDFLRISGIDTPEQYWLDPSQPGVEDVILQSMNKMDPQLLALQIEAQRIQGEQQIKAAQVSVDEKRVVLQAQRDQGELAARAEQLALEQAKLTKETDKDELSLQRDALKFSADYQKALNDLQAQEAKLEADRKQLEARIAQANAQLEIQQLKLAQEEMKLRQQMAQGGGAVSSPAEPGRQAQPAGGPIEIIYDGDKLVGVRYPDGSVRYIVEDERGRPVALTEPKHEQ